MTKLERLEMVYNALKLRKTVLDKADFAKKLGYGRTYMSDLFSGAKPLNDKFVKRLSSIFDINSNWFENETGNMFLNWASEFDDPPVSDEIMATARKASEIYHIDTEEDIDRKIEMLKMYKELIRQRKEAEAMKKDISSLTNRIETLEKEFFK